ncbi:MAG: hypothetical protein ACRYF0_07850 [Janthinobacterium lividum]
MAQQPKEERVVEILVNGAKANASLKEMAAAAAVLSNQVAKIAADDPKRGELIAQLQTMRQRITDTRAEIGGLLTAEQQLAAANQKLAESQAASVAEQERAIEAGRAGTASFNQLRTAAGLLEKQLHELGADDPGRAALLTDLQTLRGRLEEARTAMAGVIQTEAQQRAAAEALRAQEQALAEAEAQRRQGLVQLVVNGQRVSASMREMREAASQLESELNELGQEDPARGPLIAALQQLRARIHDVQQEVAGVSQTTSTMKSVMTNAFAFAVGGGIEQGIEKVGEMGKSIFTTTAKFETYGKVLSNALGSDSLGQKALADIQKMAANTPISVDALTSSFIKFVNRGLTPSMAELRKLGDLASSQGKDFDQLTEAVLDAGTGEFERLKEFGIGASKAGDQVTFSFKGVNTTVANTPGAIQAAIVAMGAAKGVAGGMALIAQGLDGQLSNLGDTADQTAVEWGQVLRPAFVAVLSTMGFLLGMLKALPGFVKENRGVILALAGALVVLNLEQVKWNLMLLEEAIQNKASIVWKTASAAATDLMAFSWKGLNAAIKANPIGFVIGLLMLLGGALFTAYEKSEKFRAVVNGLGASLKEFVVTAVQGMITALTGLGDVIMGALTLDPERIKKGLQEGFAGAKAMYWEAGKNAAKAYGEGYAEEAKNQDYEANRQYEERRKEFAQRIKDALAKRAKEEAEAAKKNRLEALKNEEAALKERLARVAKDSEAEMRIKQALVTNEASQKLTNDKLTEAERRIVLAEALDKRVNLERDFFEKQAKEREAARKKAAEAALRERLAEIEAERHHQEAKLKLSHAAMLARGDDRVSELSAIYTDGQLKIAALQAASKKEIAQLTGTAAQKKARQLDIEKELAADIALVQDKARKDQQEKLEKWAKEDASLQEKFIDGQVELIEEQAARQQAAFDVMLGAGLESQRRADELKYQARQEAFQKELALIEASLGKESALYKQVYAAMTKDQGDQGKKAVKNLSDEEKEKKKLRKLEMQTAGDVVSFGLELLDQDGEARKKHHSLYTALAAAKIIIDGTKEVQQIWEYSAENPANGETMGTAGIILGGIQTAVAIARTAVALGQLRGGGGGGGDNTSYAKGGATGTGAGLAVSPMGQLMAMSGMSVGAGGKLTDGSGFAVAGVVHEDEYVIPKWQLADPQVAAVAQWLEARRLRGFADGGPTSSGSSGATLPVAAASPATDGERTYAVQTQMLAALLNMGEQLADVKQWQRELQVRLDLRAAQAGIDEYKQVQHNSAIRSKG